MFHNQMNKSQKEPAAAKAKGVKEQCVYVQGGGGGQLLLSSTTCASTERQEGDEDRDQSKARGWQTLHVKSRTLDD